MTQQPGSVEGCRFCRANGLFEGEPLAETDAALLAGNHSDDQNFLVIPKRHYESLLDLPDDWWRHVKQLVAAIPGLTPDYNLSINIGKVAGQSVKHLHFWVVPRYDGMPASGKGLVRLIREINEQ